MDLNGMDTEAFLSKMKELFDVTLLLDGSIEASGEQEDMVRPKKKGDFSMFLADKWYLCSMKKQDVVDDPVEGLDVSDLHSGAFCSGRCRTSYAAKIHMV